MTTTDTTYRQEGYVAVDGAELWYVQQGRGPDVLLIAGLSSPMPPEGFTVEDMADDTAALVRALDLGPVHVAGFSGGSVTAQHLALRHPQLVRSLVLQSTWARWDGYVEALVRFLTWLPQVAPSERDMLEAFFLWIYTPRAHVDGTVAQIIDEALAFPHPQPPEAFHRQLAAWAVHDSTDRLHEIDVPTLVLAGEVDPMTRPEMGRVVAERIPRRPVRGAAGRVAPALPGGSRHVERARRGVLVRGGAGPEGLIRPSPGTVSQVTRRGGSWHRRGGPP